MCADVTRVSWGKRSLDVPASDFVESDENGGAVQAAAEESDRTLLENRIEQLQAQVQTHSCYAECLRPRDHGEPCSESILTLK